MKKRITLFAAVALVYMFMFCIDNTEVAAEASSEDFVAAPTPVPKAEISKDDNTVSICYDDAICVFGEKARLLTNSEIVTMPEPTPPLLFFENGLKQGETVQYFEANGVTYKVVSTVEWITSEEAENRATSTYSFD